METFVVIILLFGGPMLIAWVFELIKEWNNKRKSKIRDRVAQKILSQTEITNELIERYKERLNIIGTNKNKESSPFWLDVLSDGKKTHKHLVSGKCPDCNEGYMRVIKGEYGKFLGCSNYPNCKFTKSIKVAMKESKQESGENFTKLFNLAYK